MDTNRPNGLKTQTNWIPAKNCSHCARPLRGKLPKELDSDGNVTFEPFGYCRFCYYNENIPKVYGERYGPVRKWLKSDLEHHVQLSRLIEATPKEMFSEEHWEILKILREAGYVINYAESVDEDHNEISIPYVHHRNQRPK